MNSKPKPHSRDCTPLSFPNHCSDLIKQYLAVFFIGSSRALHVHGPKLSLQCVHINVMPAQNLWAAGADDSEGMDTPRFV